MAARHDHNGSTQMADVRRPGDASKTSHKEKNEHEREHNSEDSSSQAECSSSSSTFPTSESSSESSSPAPECHAESTCGGSHGAKVKAHNDAPPGHLSHDLCPKPTMTRSQRNSSEGVREALQPDIASKNFHKEKNGHEREHNSEDRSSQANCSSSSSALHLSIFSSGSSSEPSSESPSEPSSGPFSTEAMGRDQAEREEPPRTQKKDVASSSCCELKNLKRLSDFSDTLPHLQFSRTHVVLIDVDLFNCGGQLVAQKGSDVWQSNFVKMPSSPSSFIDKTGFMAPTRVQRWGQIEKRLSALAKKPTVSVADVEEAIIKYNPKYKGQWSFDALSAFVQCIPKTDNYINELFPKIAALALKLPDYVKKPIPLLQRGQPAMITLSQVQISCLLANAFFCTFPHRNTTAPNSEYHNCPTINFYSLFGNRSDRTKQKLRAIMHYFKEVTETKPQGLVTFERRCLVHKDRPDWRKSKETMTKLHVTSQGAIETEGTGMLQVDFACSRIGGGVLGSGLVQEEILFLINPELIVSRLFTEKLEDNECLIITGSQQFSCYSGYSDSFEWLSPHDDKLERDKWKRLKRQILAIDALSFRHRSEQYNMSKVTRELNKAYCGFKRRWKNEPDIATGKWGCGAFNGDPQLKAAIQLMAAAKANRGLAFFTFMDEKLKEDLQQFHHLLVTEGTTVGKLYDLLEDFCANQRTSRGSHENLFDFVRKKLRHSRSQL